MADLNETEPAKAALERAWQELAVKVDEAKALAEEASHDPSRLSDPRVRAETQWVWLFDRELRDVQTVHESVESGAKLSTDSLRSATQAANRLLDIITRALEGISASNIPV